MPITNSFKKNLLGLGFVASLAMGMSACSEEGEATLPLPGNPPQSPNPDPNNHYRFTPLEQNIGSYNTVELLFGDLDGDGDQDMVELNKGQSNRIYFNDGDGLFTDSNQSMGNEETTSGVLGDLDGDGDLDLVVTHDEDETTFEVWLNQSNLGGENAGVFTLFYKRTFAELTFEELREASKVQLADFDNDGDLDLMRSDHFYATIFTNDGTGNFTHAPGNYGGGTSARHTGARFAIFDMNGDNYPDFIQVGSQMADSVYINQGDASFTASGNQPTAFDAREGTTLDWDQDGDLDLIICDFLDPHVALYLNQRDNEDQVSFVDGPALSITHDKLSERCFTADVNGDGTKDLVIKSSDDDKPVVVYENIEGGFVLNELGMPETDDMDIDNIFLADVNGDGWVDIITSRERNQPNKVYLNKGE